MPVNIFHYVYRITNITLKKYYYGSRTSRGIMPCDDLGVVYFSSSHDKEFIADQKKNPHFYKYKVIKLFDTKAAALTYESTLHKKFNVDRNEKFYNLSKQTSSGFFFDSTGIRPSEETRKKLSDAQKKRAAPTEETRRKLSAARTGDKNPRFGLPGTFNGKTHSIRSKQMMSEKQQGKIRSDETKKKISDAQTGNTYRLGTLATEETRQKISAAGIGRTFSEEAKQKMSEKRKLYWLNKRLGNN